MSWGLFNFKSFSDCTYAVTNNLEDTVSACHGVCASSRRNATDHKLLLPCRCLSFLVKKRTRSLNDKRAVITLTKSTASIPNYTLHKGTSIKSNRRTVEYKTREINREKFLDRYIKTYNLSEPEISGGKCIQFYKLI